MFTSDDITTIVFFFGALLSIVWWFYRSSGASVQGKPKIGIEDIEQEIQNRINKALSEIQEPILAIERAIESEPKRFKVFKVEGIYGGHCYSESVKDTETGLVLYVNSWYMNGFLFYSCVNAEWISNAEVTYLAKILQKSRQERYTKVLEFKQGRKGLMRKRKRDQIATLYGANINNQEK